MRIQSLSAQLAVVLVLPVDVEQNRIEQNTGTGRILQVTSSTVLLPVRPEALTYPITTIERSLTVPTIYRETSVHLSPDPLCNLKPRWGRRRFCECSYALVTISCVHETTGKQIDSTSAGLLYAV